MKFLNFLTVRSLALIHGNFMVTGIFPLIFVCDFFSCTAVPPDPIRQEIYGHIKKFLDMGGTQKTD